MIFLFCFEFKCLPSISGFYQLRNARFADLGVKCGTFKVHSYVTNHDTALSVRVYQLKLKFMNCS